jgi:PTS system ascorbate-specific IIB component
MDSRTGTIKILVVCGMGLGSSYFVMQNVIQAVKVMGWNAEVENSDVFNAASMEVDLLVGADYLVDLVESDCIRIALDDLLDPEELADKMERVKEQLHD